MAIFEIDDDAVMALPNSNKFDPQAVGEELEKIRAAHSGELRPSDVVEAARNPRNPIHPHIEWNDKIAADKFRLDQARLLIRVIRVSDDNGDLRRQYINIRSPSPRYVDIDTVLKSRDLAERVLAQAESDLRAWRARFSELKELVAMTTPVLEAIQKKRAKSESARASA